MSTLIFSRALLVTLSLYIYLATLLIYCTLIVPSLTPSVVPHRSLARHPVPRFLRCEAPNAQSAAQTLGCLPQVDDSVTRPCSTSKIISFLLFRPTLDCLLYYTNIAMWRLAPCRSVALNSSCGNARTVSKLLPPLFRVLKQTCPALSCTRSHCIDQS